MFCGWDNSSELFEHFHTNTEMDLGLFFIPRFLQDIMIEKWMVLVIAREREREANGGKEKQIILERERFL